jgi:hypothetical protein
MLHVLYKNAPIKEIHNSSPKISYVKILKKKNFLKFYFTVKSNTIPNLK